MHLGIGRKQSNFDQSPIFREDVTVKSVYINQPLNVMTYVALHAYDVRHHMVITVDDS